METDVCWRCGRAGCEGGHSVTASRRLLAGLETAALSSTGATLPVSPRRSQDGLHPLPSGEPREV